jgi:hypothetical protein
VERGLVDVPTTTTLSPELQAKIDAMTHLEMAYHYRYDKGGSELFVRDVGAYFLERFKSLGGMTPEISKASLRSKMASTLP